jgi:hypothetical protein
MSPHVPAVVVLKTITLILGGLITYFAYRAYDRSGVDALGYLALGFGIVTLGTLLAGVVDQVLAYDASMALLVESAMTTVGFAVIVYSLYTR